MRYNKIKIYLRACQPSNNKPNSGRPPWFSEEKCFYNLLKTINYNIADLTVVYDGNVENTFTELLREDYPYEIKLIDTRSFTGKSYEPDCGSSKSLCLTSEIIKNDGVQNHELIYILEQDYLHLPGWCEEVLDLYNNFEGYAHQSSDRLFCSCYTHPDKVIFNRPHANNEFGIYKDLRCKVIAAKNRYWAFLPSITSSIIMTKNLFDEFYFYFINGYSDNTMCAEFIKRGASLIAPVEKSLACHCQLPWLSFYIDWAKVSRGEKC